MKRIKILVRRGSNEFCDECQNYVKSDFFLRILTFDDACITLCAKHARELAGVLVRVCWGDHAALTPATRRP